MEFGSLDGGEDGEHNGVDFVEISKMSAMQDAFFIETEPFDRVRHQRSVGTNYSVEQHT